MGLTGHTRIYYTMGLAGRLPALNVSLTCIAVLCLPKKSDSALSRHAPGDSVIFQHRPIF